MRFLKRTGIALAVIYVCICAALFFYQERLIFHPRPRAADFKYGNYPEEYIEVEPGVRLNAITLQAEAGQPSDRVVLYLHGNVGDNGRSLYQTRSLTGLGADLFLVDYRGFGKSEGHIAGEATMTEDLQKVYDHLKSKYQESQIVIAGYSLGTGPAAYLASRNDPRGVVLVAPYTSLVDMKNEFFWMFPDFLMSYTLNSAEHLAQSDAPVTILHGTADQLIPFEMAETLAAVDPNRIKLIPLDGLSHRQAVLDGRFGEAVRQLLE